MRRLLLFMATIVAANTNTNAQRWHIKPTPEEIAYRQQHPRSLPQSAQKPSASTFTMPAGARFPGEFEESQAVAIAWVSDYPDTTADVTSAYADIWAEMANGIQNECAVWIRIQDPADSNRIKNFMSSRGTPLKNYKFFVTVGDDFWVRDFGPLSFYYGPNDDIGMLDMNYYPGRDMDNLYPGFLAAQTGYMDVKTNLYAEGGNYITDGFHKSFHSNVIESVNASGPPYTPAHAPWSTAQILDTLKYVWASNEVVSTPTLVCDGGTGHNDMFMKMVDENTFMVMEYPAIVTATDRNIINNVINTLSSSNSVYGRPYRIFKMPMPTQDNGDILKDCNSINGDARTFVNGTTVNGTYLMPTYSGGGTGNEQADKDGIAAFKRNAPGYKVVPIDSRLLTVLGGAIHCVNMQIPAENPVSIWHPPIQDLQPRKNSFHIVVKATNKSGIANAKCYWKLRGTQDWKTVNLTDSSGYYVGDITGSFKLLDDNAAIEYYVTASSNNGKTMSKPIVANNGGYYTFYFSPAATTRELDFSRNFALNPIPNPTTGNFVIPVSFDREMAVTADVVDVMGRHISTIDFGKKQNGMSKLNFDLGSQPSGMYFIRLVADGQLLGTSRIMKQ